MAARKQLWHDGATREKIQASQLINRLSDHVFGKIDLSPTQVRSAEILLRKVMPDLALVDHTGEVEHHFVARIPEPSASPIDWKNQHGPKLINGKANI